MSTPDEHLYARVVWTPEDVMSFEINDEPCLNREEAEQFLQRNEHNIQDRMVERGWSCIEDLLHFEGVL